MNDFIKYALLKNKQQIIGTLLIVGISILSVLMVGIVKFYFGS